MTEITARLGLESRVLVPNSEFFLWICLAPHKGEVPNITGLVLWEEVPEYHLMVLKVIACHGAGNTFIETLLFSAKPASESWVSEISFRMGEGQWPCSQVGLWAGC